jgi:predicted dienelactone hydrolase
MVGTILILLLGFIELGFIILDLKRGSDNKKEKSLVRIVLFLVFLLLVITPVIDWGFAWYGLGLILLIQAILSVLFVIHKKGNRDNKASKIIVRGIYRCIVIGFAIFPVILFPQREQILPTGNYAVGTKSYTWTDETREEYFTEAEDRRNVTVQFYYPTEEEVKSGTAAEGASIVEGKYPLVIFSHGAFGYRRSNYSAYLELASHGYIVCSIDHTYHAFFTKEVTGKVKLVNREFLNEVLQLENNELMGKEAYQLEQKWLKLRTEDMKFVLNQIKLLATSDDTEPLFQELDLEHIGAFGHSLGGAASAQIGRELKDIDAVIVLDGTMLGEVTGVKDGKDVLINTPYPKPIMNLYNEFHYKDAMKIKDSYANTVATENAIDAYQVVIRGTGHLNFTDLPLASPILAGMLGTGKVDARSCILTMDKTILEFFDHYLKGSAGEIERERSY